jgi:hypothetical protein
MNDPEEQAGQTHTKKWRDTKKGIYNKY